MEKEESKDYKYYTFDSEHSILYHEVNNKNFGNMESFVLSLSTFSTLIQKLVPKYLIIKVFKKPSYFELEMKHFMEISLLKAIMDAGIKKIAFYMDDKESLGKMIKYENSNPIQVKFFGDMEKAKQWILS